MGDDHFHDIVWEAAGRFVCGVRFRRRITEQVVDLGLASKPNDRDAIREAGPYDVDSAEIRSAPRTLAGYSYLVLRIQVPLSDQHPQSLKASTSSQV